jgi:hypothetical protein
MMKLKVLDFPRVIGLQWMMHMWHVQCEHYIVPFPGKKLGKSKDTFNFYQSKTRIHIEQAFGILVRRWGILWRKLESSMKYWSLIVLCCMKLHNICIDFQLKHTHPFQARSQFGLTRTIEETI